MKLTLDLHEVFNRNQDIDRALRDIMSEAVAKKAMLVEIIPGKGSGQLKKRVLRFLGQKVTAYAHDHCAPGCDLARRNRIEERNDLRLRPGWCLYRSGSG